MSIFPLTQPLDDSALLKTTCHLYRISLLRVLALSALFVVILHYFRFGKAYLPIAWQPYHLQSAMVLLILSLPVIGAMITVIDKVAKNSPYTFWTITKEVGDRFLSLMGALISIALLPLILFGVCYAIYFYLIYLHLPVPALFAWQIFSLLLVFLTIVTKIYAPWLIFSDGLDANDAQDMSGLLVKGRFLKSFIHALFAVLVIVFLIKLPGLIEYYFSAAKSAPQWAIALVADIILMIIGPWSLVFLLTDKYNLQNRNNNKALPQTKKTQVKVQSAISKKSNNVTF
ncbi:hypothetical protein [Candidatus Berkiella aquae]|uniref:Uncharacterized protein n=1 Tax=Candidatus Berkiella aquae TaxID=295108 RepID=A0A0Q9YNX3_9GAMM|nr:hypothetical protein [Candidatus Berkiella aquae]MCS5712124.1 hypothetical protein [Candidatus Berkiella aquae]